MIVHTVLFTLKFCGLVIFIKNFDPINIRRPWAPEITMFCSEFIMTKTFNPIKTSLTIWFHIFFSKACFSSWPLLFLHLGCFWLDYYSTWPRNNLWIERKIACFTSFANESYSYITSNPTYGSVTKIKNISKYKIHTKQLHTGLVVGGGPVI